MKSSHSCGNDFSHGRVSGVDSLGRSANGVLGLQKPSEMDMLEKRDREMRTLYVDPIEHFPKQVERLLVALTEVSVTW